MPAVPRWDCRTFTLTNPYNGSMEFNVQSADGLFALDPAGCSFDLGVRSTSDNVPQSDGSILHHRFLTGATMDLTIQLWENPGSPACDDVQAAMLDELSGAFRSLLNAGDNAGRLAWTVSGKNVRMLDDIRLAPPYPVYRTNEAGSVLVAKIDSQYPYAQDLTQQSTDIADGATETIDNTGTAEYFPVFQVQGPTTAFTLENLTTGIQFEYNAGLPGAVAIGGGDYAEIDIFRNTIFLNGSGANLKAGVVQLDSDYWGLRVGENDVTIDGADVTVLWAPAWG